MTSQLIQEFKGELKRVANANNCDIKRAFLLWYLENRFEKEAKVEVTDGQDDGGIDAVVSYDNRTYVIQSEFAKDIFSGKSHISGLSLMKIAQFDQIPSKFRDNNKFTQWLNTVEPSIHPIYEKLRRKFQKDENSVIWEFTTLHSLTNSGVGRLQDLVVDNFLVHYDNLRLFQLSLVAATPPSEELAIIFNQHFIVEDKEKNIISYVLQARIKNLIDYLDKDPYFRVLAQNVRSKIPKSDVNDDIKDTFSKKPDEFWYSHNGITIICDQATLRGNKIILKRPSVINGAQTLHSLKGLKNRDPNATVLVRIMRIFSQDEKTFKFINDIIFRTNQQNKINKYDLRANDRIQVKLTKNFSNHKVFYERKVGEWDLNKRTLKNEGFERLKITELAQYLVTCRDDLGSVVTAKGKKELLFSESKYDKIFSDITFKEIFFKYCLMRYCKKSFKKIRQGGKKGRYLLSTTFAILWECVAKSRDANKWIELNERQRGGFTERDDKGKRLSKDIRKIYSKCLNQFNIERQKNPNLELRIFINSREWNRKLSKKIVPMFSASVQKQMKVILKI